MPTPVDATQTEAWKKLSQLHSELNVDFREWFAADPERTEKFSSAQVICSLIYPSLCLPMASRRL